MYAICRQYFVALRKESVDRNVDPDKDTLTDDVSLSARRAWIEITNFFPASLFDLVALRKESVDRNSLLCRILFRR